MTSKVNLSSLYLDSIGNPIAMWTCSKSLFLTINLGMVCISKVEDLLSKIFLV